MNRNGPVFKLWLALPRLVLVGIWFSFSLTLATPVFGQPEGSAVLRFERVGPASADASVQVVLLPRNAGENDKRLEAILKPGRVAEVVVPPGSSWVGEVSTSGFWSPRLEVTAGAAGSSVEKRVRIWPATRVEGILRRPDGGDNVPRELTLELASPPTPGQPGQKPEIDKAASRCDVVPGGHFSCPLPVALLDLTLKADGYAPIYFWSQWPEANRPLHLGGVVVRHGGSIAGFVSNEGQGASLVGAVAKVSPYLAAGVTHDVETERLRRLTAESKVTERGFFQVPSLAAGDYLLEVSKPGLAPAKAFPLKVWPGAETFLNEPLVLRPPLPLVVKVQPSIDWHGKPWHVTLRRHSEWSGGFEHPDVFAGKASLEGRVVVPGQAPGRFSVAVADSRGNRLLFAQELPVTGPDDAELAVEIPLVIIDGEVSWRDEPVPAELRFGGTFGAVSIDMSAGEDGVFSGMLPREGPWQVDLLLHDPEIRTHAKVQVKAGSSGVARVKVEVPDSRVFGTVVYAEGQPAAGARVSLYTMLASREAVANSQGQFEFLAVPEGTLALSAKADSPEGPATSKETTLELSEESPAGPLVLRVETTTELEGRVGSTHGVVAGASVSAWCLSPRASTMESARSGVDGAFRVRAPGKCQRLALAVSPPGHALSFFEVVPSAGSVGLLTVAAEGGTLEVLLPGKPDPAEEPKYNPVILRDRLGVPFSVFSRWAAGNGRLLLQGDTLRVPRLEPGPYRVCLAVPSLKPPEEGGQPFAENLCREGFLPAGGVLRLEIPEPAKAGHSHE